jgi:iron(III) transport system permease protein
MIPSLLGGWALVFVSTMGDVTAAALVGSTRTPVVGFRILDLQNSGGFPEMAALGVVMTLTTTTVVMTTNVLLNRRGVNVQA